LLLRKSIEPAKCWLRSSILTSMQSPRTCRRAKLPWVTGLCHQGRESNQRLKPTGVAFQVLRNPHHPRRPQQLSLNRSAAHAVVPRALPVSVTSWNEYEGLSDGSP